jgi:hypothetical protein
MRELNMNNEAVVSLTVPELISILKSVLIDRRNVDLDELNVTVIYKYSNDRLHITLDADLLRQKSKYAYLEFINDVKKAIDPYIFTVNTAVDVNILINKLFSGFDYYTIDENMIIKIYY